MNAPSVIQPEACSSTYRCAVETILRDIMRATEITLRDIAEDIGVSENTLYNALHQRSDLSAAFLARLGQRYGGAFLNPYLNLFGAQAAPMEKRRTKDILPVAIRVAHKIALARDPDGPGGTTEVPQERSAYLPDLKELNRETACQIAEIEAVLA